MLFLLGVGTLLVCLGAVSREHLKPEPSELFRRYVQEPIPQSVAETRADRPKTIGGYGYVFRFAISKSDLSLLRDSRGLKPVTNMSYGYGLLNLEWDRTVTEEKSPDYISHHISEGGLSVYGQWSRIPPWSSGLDEWTDVGSYALEGVKQRPGKRHIGIVEVLIYNEGLGEAYFFAWGYK